MLLVCIIQDQEKVFLLALMLAKASIDRNSERSIAGEPSPGPTRKANSTEGNHALSLRAGAVTQSPQSGPTCGSIQSV